MCVGTTETKSITSYQARTTTKQTLKQFAQPATVKKVVEKEEKVSIRIIEALRRPAPPKGLTRKEWDNLVADVIEIIEESYEANEKAAIVTKFISHLLDYAPNDHTIRVMCDIVLQETTFNTKEEQIKFLADQLVAISN